MKHHKTEGNNERIRRYLFQGEEILQNYKNFYATNRRLIQIKNAGFFDIAYEHITTIEYKHHRKVGIAIPGFLFIIIGVAFINYLGILLVIGIILVIIGLIPVNYYILHTDGNQDIRFIGSNSEDTQNFLKVIRKQMNKK